MIPYTMECAIIITRPPPLPRPLASIYSTHTSYTSNDEYNSKSMLALLA